MKTKISSSEIKNKRENINPKTENQKTEKELVFSKRFGEAVVILLLPILLYGIVGPVEIFVGNINEFNFVLKDFYIPFVIISLIILLGGGAILAVFPRKIARVFELLIFAVGLLSYIQNMFLNKQLIKQDGTSMDWNSLKSYTIINLIIWIVLFLLICCMPFLLKKSYVKIMVGLSGFISAIQIVAFIGLLVSALSIRYEDNQYTLSGEKQYQVASGHNVIVFVLDHYSNGTFNNCVEEHPEMAERLKDFTYYNNAECHYSYTFPSLAHMLTGEDVDCMIKPDVWKEQCWESERCIAFYNKLHEMGYECNLYSAGSVFGVLGSITYLDGKMDNVIPAMPVINHALLSRLFEKMTVYRNVPYIVKPRFETLNPIFDVASHYDVEQGVEYENIAFYDSLKTEGLSIDEEMVNEFIIIHLEGTHGLRTTTAEATYTEAGKYADEDEPTPEETAQGLSIILDEYIRRLKELGVYDSATIIITADHGDEGEPQPIFFMKQSGEMHSAMEINTAPISHDDFQATILESIGLEYDEYGTSVTDWNPGDMRERESWFSEDGFRVYTYTGNCEDLLDVINRGEYRVEGVNTGWKHSW